MFGGILMATVGAASLVPIAHAQGLSAPVDPAPKSIVARDAGAISSAPARSAAARPNVVIILLDDAGFGGASAFGGPARTATLDRLAAQGLRYNRFHVAAICSATRAALLSGRNDHAVGFGTVEEAATDDPGYNAIWPRSAASIAQVLRQDGYSTAAFGKWHNTPHQEITPIGPFDRWPTGLGFEYFYGFMGGWDNHWEPSRLYRNTTAVEAAKSPEQGYYLTTDLTDDAISWVRTQRSLAPDKPYLMYFATGATHWPHQVPKEWIDKYRGQFDQGWDKLREQTFARQKALGIVPKGAKLSARSGEITAWKELSADEKRLSARQMELFAGFLDYTDHEIGRLVKTIQEGPGGDNTLILYIAGDNGMQQGTNENQLPDAVVQYYLNNLEELGGTRIAGMVGSGWALAASTPFPWMKHFASHLGGTRAPLVVSWPAGIRKGGGVRSQYTHLVDVAPTIYELAGLEAPKVVDGVAQMAIDGTSFAYSFDDAKAPSRHRVQVFEQAANRSIYRDGWLAAARHLHLDHATGALRMDGSIDDDRWELYNLTEDFSQANDVADRYPEKLRELRQLFDDEARRTNIYPIRNFESPPKLPVRADHPSEYIFYPGLPRLSATAAPHFYAGSHTISAEVVIPKENAGGVLLSYGSRMGGFALYAKEGRLVYEANDGSRRTAVKSSTPLAAGKATITAEFIRDPVQAGAQPDVAAGTVRLYVDRQKVAEQGNVRQATSFVALDAGTFGIGRAYGSPISDEIRPPFSFNGVLERVSVTLK